VILENLKMNALQGSLELSGEYNTKDIRNPAVDFGIKAVNIDIPLAYEAFGILQQFAPIAKKAQGKVSVGLTYSSFLDETMMPKLSSIIGKGDLTANTIGLKSSDMFLAVGKQLNTKLFDNMAFNALGIKFELRNINMNVKVTGTFKNPSIKLDLKDNAKQTTQAIKEEVTQAAREELDKRKEEARAVARAEADKILQEAQKQADEIKKKAGEAAEIVKKEAASNGEKLIKQASNPIAKKAAEQAARKLNQEAEESAQKIIKEGDARADVLMKEAQAKADKLLQ
jgi:vacuolar-type H+-ATPase subunit H